VNPLPASPAPATAPVTVKEQAVRQISLTGPAAKPKAELSGLAWYRDWLILLPQYPSRFGEGPDGAVFALAKRDILDYLQGRRTEPLEPILVPFQSGGMEREIRGFEGYEAIAFTGNSAYLTIESRPGLHMLGTLVQGEIAPDLSALRLNPAERAEIAPQANIPNMADETVFIHNEKVFSLYEANGVKVNPDPAAHVFNLALEPLGTIPFPNIEYRITDATQPDSEGYFWAINYFYPGDIQLKPSDDPLADRFGRGETGSLYPQVERLVEFRITGDAIVLTESPPILLELAGADLARNWEGIARLDDLGFLLATDKFPETILAFVKGPGR
jgi:hypothetical protein